MPYKKLVDTKTDAEIKEEKREKFGFDALKKLHSNKFNSFLRALSLKANKIPHWGPVKIPRKCSRLIPKFV